MQCKRKEDIINNLAQLIIEQNEAMLGKDIAEKSKEKRRTSMKFFTALNLSLNNLMTKKGRTILTSFAGSIGIIGIALILSLSNGVAKYIDNKEEEALSNYPLTIQKNTMDMTSMMTSMMESSKEEYNDDLIHSNNILSNLLTSLKTKTNNLKDFINQRKRWAAGCIQMEKN